MAPRKKKTAQYSDYGPAERQQHGEYVEVETAVAGVKALRNVTVDPIDTYYKRGNITYAQYQAATTFANQFAKAGMTVRYSQSKYGAAAGGEPSDNHLDVVHDTRKRVLAALAHVGQPLAGIVEHVAGYGEAAGTWSGSQRANRPDIEGMVALRMALDGLVSHYKLG